MAMTMIMMSMLMKIILRRMVSLHTVARDKMQGLLGAGGPV